MKTRTDRNGKSLTNVNIWLETDLLGELAQEAGRLTTAEGRIVSRTDFIRAALRKAVSEARAHGGRPVDPDNQP